MGVVSLIYWVENEMLSLFIYLLLLLLLLLFIFYKWMIEYRLYSYSSCFGRRDYLELFERCFKNG